MKLALMVGPPDMAAEGGYVKTPIGAFDKTVARAAWLGFDGVEVLAGKRTNGDIYALREALRHTNMEATFNSGRLFFDHGLVLLCGTSKQCSMTRAAMYDLIRFAGAFSGHINIGMFRGMPTDPDQGPALDRLVEIMRQFADYALGLGVDLLLEPSNKKEFPFISSTSEGLEMVKRIDRPNVGIMLDTFHMHVEGEDMIDSLERAMPYLRHIHFLDPNRDPPSRATTAFDVRGIFRTLARHNYGHLLSMPLTKHKTDAESDAATAEIVRYLRSLT